MILASIHGRATGEVILPQYDDQYLRPESIVPGSAMVEWASGRDEVAVSFSSDRPYGHPQYTHFQFRLSPTEARRLADMLTQAAGYRQEYERGKPWYSPAPRDDGD